MYLERRASSTPLRTKTEGSSNVCPQNVFFGIAVQAEVGETAQKIHVSRLWAMKSSGLLDSDGASLSERTASSSITAWSSISVTLLEKAFVES